MELAPWIFWYIVAVLPWAPKCLIFLMTFWRNFQRHSTLQKETGILEQICLFTILINQLPWMLKSIMIESLMKEFSKETSSIHSFLGFDNWCKLFLKNIFLGISLPMGRWTIWSGKQFLTIHLTSYWFNNSSFTLVLWYWFTCLTFLSLSFWSFVELLIVEIKVVTNLNRA